MRPRPPRRQQRLCLLCPQPLVVRPEEVWQELRRERDVVDLWVVWCGRGVRAWGGVPWGVCT